MTNESSITHPVLQRDDNGVPRLNERLERLKQLLVHGRFGSDQNYINRPDSGCLDSNRTGPNCGFIQHVTALGFYVGNNQSLSF